MHRIPAASLAVALLVSLYSPSIHADDNDGGGIQSLCNNVGSGSWKGEKKVLEKVKAMGFTPLRVKIEKGCWQVDAMSQDNQRVEIYIHPTSGKTMMRKLKESVIPPAVAP